jgi:hypothetical protein
MRLSTLRISASIVVTVTLFLLLPNDSRPQIVGTAIAATAASARILITKSVGQRNNSIFVHGIRSLATIGICALISLILSTGCPPALLIHGILIGAILSLF